MDPFSEYHQVFMTEQDKEKTTFITYCGVYNYVMMPFSLKYAGSNFQRLMKKVFKDQRGRNVEVHVDDSIIRAKKDSILIKDLCETFDSLRAYPMKLKPTKCTFAIKEGKFLGFIISEWEIVANLVKVKDILELQDHKTINNIQMLTGRLISLTSLIAILAERPLPFFKVLKENKDFV